MKISRDGSIPVIEIDSMSDVKSLGQIARFIRRNPEKFRAMMDKFREEQRRDKEDGPPKNRAILEKPDRI